MFANWVTLVERGWLGQVSSTLKHVALDYSGQKRYMTIYMVRNRMWTQSIWQRPKPI